MPRKKSKPTDVTAHAPTGAATAVAEPGAVTANRPAWATALETSLKPTTAVAEGAEALGSRPAYIDGPPVDRQGDVIRDAEKARGKSVGQTTQPIASKATDRVAGKFGARPAMNAADETNSPVGGERGTNWGDPYKAIVTAQTFEMGENRRFKQRMFKFKEKPADDVIATLKDSGFTYRAAEKAWTISANPDTRRLSDELAQQFRGPGQSMER